MVVNIVVVLAVLRDSNDDNSGEEAAGPRLPRVGRVVENRAIGARIRMPKGWKVRRGGRMIILRSPESSTIMSISGPPGARNSRNVLGTAVAAIRQQYRGVTARRLAGKVSGLPTVSRVVSATNKRGVRLNILVAAPQGRARAWLVEVFSGPGARAKRLPEAQAALGTLRLRG